MWWLSHSMLYYPRASGTSTVLCTSPAGTWRPPVHHPRFEKQLLKSLQKDPHVLNWPQQAVGGDAI